MKVILCTCCDDIPSCLESLIIKMVLCAQYKYQVNICIAQVHIGNWHMELDAGDERFGIACRGTGPLHLANWQTVIDLETKKQQITHCTRHLNVLLFSQWGSPTYNQAEVPPYRGSNVSANLSCLFEDRPLRDDTVSGGLPIKWEEWLKVENEAGQGEDHHELDCLCDSHAGGEVGRPGWRWRRVEEIWIDAVSNVFSVMYHCASSLFLFLWVDIVLINC